MTFFKIYILAEEIVGSQYKQALDYRLPSLYQDLVISGQYKFLMTGRLMQDCVENLFSQIRSKGDSHPLPVHFRHIIRLISISQFMHVPNNSSYDTDTSMYFLDFIKKYPKRATNENVSVVTEDCPSFLYLSECEGNALYNLAGWAVFKEKKFMQDMSDLYCWRCI